MKKLILLLAILVSGIAQAQVYEEYIDGRLVKSQVVDGVSVSTSLRKVARNDGKYYMFDISITNGTDLPFTVRVSEFRAALNTKKGLRPARVLTRKEYLKIKKRRENLRVGLMAFGGALSAASAGYSSSSTYSSGNAYYSSNTSGNANVRGSYGQRLGSVDYSSNTSGYASYSGSSHTQSYNGEAAYWASQNEAAKLQAFSDASAAARGKWNNAYLKNNTLSPLESMNGIINVKFKKSNLCIIAIYVNGNFIEFEWNPADAEN